MSNVVQFPSEREIVEAAGEWIARLDRGLSQEELVQFQAWMALDRRHPDALYHLAAVWDRMDLLRDMSSLFALQPSPPVPARLRVGWTPAVSFSLLAVVAMAGWLVTNEVRARNFEATYQTPIGKQLNVELPDHSRIRLNTSTLVKVHYSRRARSVEMLQGEAHFEVAKSEGRTFSVHAGGSEFRAVGTAFDVRLGDAEGAATALTVTEGRVQVLVSPPADSSHGFPAKTRGAAASVDESPSTASATEIMVDAGKQVAIGAATQTVTRLSPAQFQAAVAWQDGMILFDALPLEEAIHEVGRYSIVQFRIDDDRIRHIRVSGYFKAGDVDALITSLQNNFDIHVTREGNVVVLNALGQ